jgi:hypothetical protein
VSVPTEAVTTKALSASHLAFRDEVRAMLAAELTAEMRQAAANTTTVFADRNLALAWQAIVAAGPASPGPSPLVALAGILPSGISSPRNVLVPVPLT